MYRAGVNRLKEMRRASTVALQANLAEIRAGLDHNPSRGTGGEAILTRFLRAHLPSSLGITTGQIADHTGALSRQQDIIIFDATRTSRLFTITATSGNAVEVIPIEGVLATVEVKLHLQAKHVGEIKTNVDSIQALQPRFVGPPVDHYELMGCRWPEVPPLHSVFAFESDAQYAARFNRAFADKPLHQKLGTVCYLDRGLSLHSELAPDNGQYTARWAAHPVAPGALADIETDDALLIWLAGLSDTTVQALAHRRTADLMSYAGDATALVGSLSGDTQPERIALVIEHVTKLYADHGFSEARGREFAEAMFIHKRPFTDEEIRDQEAAGLCVSLTPTGLHRVSM